jgi:hypothetical protein
MKTTIYSPTPSKSVGYGEKALGLIPPGMYEDDDGDIVVINHSGNVGFVCLRRRDAAVHKGTVASDSSCIVWPISPAPPGTKLEFIAE